MKGILLLGGFDYIVTQFGEKPLKEAQKKCHLRKMILPFSDVDEESIKCLINELSINLGLSSKEIMEKVGYYWTLKKAPEFYPQFYEKYNRSVREFLINLNYIHKVVVENVVSSKKLNPPEFEVIREEKNYILLRYISKRNMIHVAIGAIKGLGQYFKEDIKVVKQSDDTMLVHFIQNLSS